MDPANKKRGNEDFKKIHRVEKTDDRKRVKTRLDNFTKSDDWRIAVAKLEEDEDHEDE